MRIVAPSFRARILLVVLTVAVVPLALIGLWLTQSASRSGQALLEARLDESLDQTVAAIGGNWLRYRSDLLFLGEDADVQRVLAGSGDEAVSSEAPASLRSLFEGLDAAVLQATIRDLEGRELWKLTRDDYSGGGTGTSGPSLLVRLPIYQRFPGGELGTLEVSLDPVGLLGSRTATPVGLVLSMIDAERDVPLLPLPFDPNLLAQRTFSWAGDDWLAVRRSMTEPPLVLSAAAPLSPFAAPFEEAARDGTLLLAVVSLAGLTAAWFLTRRLTWSLERLAGAAEAVAQGDLEARIEVSGTDEVGRVTQAFNTMTASLRHTLDELAARERLAAVGEFAASLAHEVRNPLTAIRINLQRVEEQLPSDSPLRGPQSRALQEVSRLDATVSETLDVARTGKWRKALVDLAVPLRAAAEAAEPAFVEHGATLDLSGLNGECPSVEGDASSLEQLFLNLLLNAANALGPDGSARIDVSEDVGKAVVSIVDTGTGIPPEMLERIFQPLFTTRAEGTGLGLTVARRIVDQYDGDIEIESEVGVGTSVRVSLPLPHPN